MTLFQDLLSGTYPMVPAAQGRFFFRNQGEVIAAIVGVLDVPATLPAEHLVPARLNTDFWLDPAQRVDPVRQGRHRGGLGEHDVSSLLTSMGFARGALPDAMEVFLRHSAIEHEHHDRRWMIVAALTSNQLRAAPTDGLYELQPGKGPVLIDGDPRRGFNVGQVLREPLWGPQGRYGLATSMELNAYERFIPDSRARAGVQDPLYAEFFAEMAKCPRLPLAYTREQSDAFSALSVEVLRGIIDDGTDASPQAKIMKKMLAGTSR